MTTIMLGRVCDFIDTKLLMVRNVKCHFIILSWVCALLSSLAAFVETVLSFTTVHEIRG